MRHLSLVILAALILFSGPLHAVLREPSQERGGDGTRGGGNGEVGEFVRVASYGLNLLISRGSLIIDGKNIDLVSMLRVLSPALTIRPTTEPLPPVNRQPVCATNDFRLNLIELDTICWNGKTPEAKLQLALHEIWGIAFHDHQDDSFHYSTEMSRRVRLIEENNAKAHYYFFEIKPGSVKPPEFSYLYGGTLLEARIPPFDQTIRFLCGSYIRRNHLQFGGRAVSLTVAARASIFLPRNKCEEELEGAYRLLLNGRAHRIRVTVPHEEDQPAKIEAAP